MKNFSYFIFAIFIMIAIPTTSFAWNSSAILDNGNPTNRVNIVFVGDGYQATEIADYQADVQNTLDYILSEPPFSQYASYFNAYRVDVISNQSGADHPDQNIYVDTALDSSYSWNGQATRCLYADYTKVINAAADSPVPATQGLVFVIVNDTQYGGCGGTFAVFSTHTTSNEIAVHELGHSFGRLADEYFTIGDTYIGTEPIQPNVTIETNRNNIKWNTWINATTPIPTTTTTNGIPGLYEGGKYNEFGIYRPTFNSKMRALSFPFEQINTEQLIKRIYNFVSPVDIASPITGVASIASGGSQTFSVSLMAPTGLTLSVRWYLNNVLVGTGKSYTLSASALSQADVLNAVVTDPNNQVRNDPASVMTETLTWNPVVGNAPAVIISPVSGSTISSSTTTFNWTAGTGDRNFWVGTTGPGSYDVYKGLHFGDTQATVTGIPLTGSKIYVRLLSFVSGIWQYRDYTYQTLALEPSEITSPVPGSTLTSPTVTFNWTAGSGDRWLYVGTTGTGSADVYAANHTGETQATVNGIAMTGNTLYVRLWSFVSGSWMSRDYVYQTQAPPTPAEMTSPTPGSRIRTSTVTFRWTTGTSDRELWIGTTGAGSTNVYQGNHFRQTQATVSGIPLTGRTLYVRLWSVVNGNWQFIDYTYRTRR